MYNKKHLTLLVLFSLLAVTLVAGCASKDDGASTDNQNGGSNQNITDDQNRTSRNQDKINDSSMMKDTRQETMNKSAIVKK